MSTEIGMIVKTGRHQNADLYFTEFRGGGQRMIQITQGRGIDPDEPGFIQLSAKDAKLLTGVLKKWTKSIASDVTTTSTTDSTTVAGKIAGASPMQS